MEAQSSYPVRVSKPSHSPKTFSMTFSMIRLIRLGSSGMTKYAGIGSRKTPSDCLAYMQDIALGFAKLGYILRSGGARGADTAFEDGCKIANGKREIYLAEDATPEAMEHAAEFHPNWHACSPYAKRLHARNSMIILGGRLNDPVDFVVCWTPSGVKIGGTAQALRVAEHYEIPIINVGDEDWGFDA